MLSDREAANVALRMACSGKVSKRWEDELMSALKEGLAEDGEGLFSMGVDAARSLVGRLAPSAAAHVMEEVGCYDPELAGRLSDGVGMERSLGEGEDLDGLLPAAGGASPGGGSL